MVTVVLILAAKSGLAIMLLVAAGAKLSDLAGFIRTVRMLGPLWLPRAVVGGATLSVVLVEVALGTASLCSPAVWWLNPAVFVLACGFVGISAFGYRFHRGRSCSCFGMLSARKYDRGGIVRSIATAAVAAVAMQSVPSGYVHVETTERVLLLAFALFFVFLSRTAARGLSSIRATQPGLIER